MRGAVRGPVPRLRRVMAAARGDALADLVLLGGRVVVEGGRPTVPVRRALATSASHDAPNIVVAGLDERDMLGAVREVQRMQGGVVAVQGAAPRRDWLCSWRGWSRKSRFPAWRHRWTRSPACLGGWGGVCRIHS